MATAKKTGKTLDDLRALHDKTVLVPSKIRSAFDAMVSAGEDWLYDEDFRKLAMLSPVDLKDFREEFKTQWAEMPATNGRRDARRVWFATKALCTKWLTGK